MTMRAKRVVVYMRLGVTRVYGSRGGRNIEVRSPRFFCRVRMGLYAVKETKN